MKKIAAASLVTAISLMLLALPGAPRAQQPAGTPSGDALQARTEKVRDALLKGTPDDLLAQLAPWIRGRVAIKKAEAADELAKMSAAERDAFAKAWAGELRAKHDPDNTLKVEKPEDLAKLSEAQMLCLMLDYYVLRAAENEARRSAAWHLVDRSVGFEQYQEATATPAKKGAPRETRWLTRTRGKAVFMSAGNRDMITVSCVAEGDSWQVDDIEFRVGKVRGRLSGTEIGGKWSTRGQRDPASDAWRAEGEQILGSMKNRVKVTYAKTNAVPGALTGRIGNGGCGVQEAELEGKHFSIKDAILTNANSDVATMMVVAKAEYEDAGVGVGQFFMTDPVRDTITWFDSMEEALKEYPGFKD